MATPNTGESRRAALGKLIEEAKQNLQEIRHRVRDADTMAKRRHRCLDGHRTFAPFIVLQLLVCYGAGEAMLTAISKFLVSPQIWTAAGKNADFNWTARLRDLMDRPRVTLAAAEIWANRCAPQHRRIIRKARRILAEYQVFKDLIQANKRGTAPKRATLVQALKRYWVFDDVGSDALPNNLHTLEQIRRWVHRFRRFWQVSWGKLALRSALTPEEQSAKVIGENRI